ncbi:aldose epimerase [Pseudoxanthomonas broegbernensis]|uniref:Aldose epimerase n=1 Tax=Pseudoxanthomonas broegbernensis TaxID=83619 RepID=A0A7V8GKS3_9GAMM|nr:aldose epimerase [Pseudoxanthomonas broegbernensis]KAF1685332.1 aldose epimerase [Pseudoxanthomonas broegbernensis]MBB6066200.1 aldose 1-epimerase [Pseudoxanthomonas broegbernensis]
MASDAHAPAAGVDPTSPLAPGPLLTLADGALSVDIAPAAGGRIAQIRCDGIEQLVGHGEHGSTAAIAWGAYPMVPWCGRIRDGRFRFEGRDYALPANLGPHAIHGVGYLMPWQVTGQSPRHVELELAMPSDHRWPFGGIARQRIELDGRRLVMDLSATATGQAMPVTLGWHPWFRKPERLEFHPEAMYPRDAGNITVLPPGELRPGPWDDCFVNRREVVVHRGGQRIRLNSECSDWVVYDEPAFATCVEPQTAMPDGFNLAPERMLRPGQTAAARYVMEWD